MRLEELLNKQFRYHRESNSRLLACSAVRLVAKLGYIHVSLKVMLVSLGEK